MPPSGCVVFLSRPVNSHHFRQAEPRTNPFGLFSPLFNDIFNEIIIFFVEKNKDIE